MSPLKKVQITERGVEESPMHITDAPFSDQLDIARLSIDVDKAIRDELGKDYVLAFFNDQQREFIVEQVKVAYVLGSQTPDEEIGKRIRKGLMLEIHSIAVLHRNLERNPLLKDLLTSGRDREEEDLHDERKSALDWIKNKFKPDAPQEV